ncbi:MAG: FliM/FliN family flagellar motor switch protein [Thiotrichaceae bacterium]
MALRLSNHTQLQFPEISNELASWKNTLSAKKSSLAFSLGDPKTIYTARIYSHHFTIDNYSLGLLVEIDGVPASVWLTSWPFDEKLEGYLGAKKLDQLPVDLRAELLETTLKPLLSKITLRTNAQIRILNFLKLKPSEVNDYSLGIALQDNKNKQEVKIVMLMHSKLLPIIQRILGYWPDQNTSFWYQQNTQMWLQAGVLDLTLQELDQLDTSDILIMELSGENQQIHLRLGSGDFFHASVNSNQLTLESGIQKMSDENLNDSFNETNTDTIASIQDVPVRLTFDLGDLILPFKEIQSLTQGYLIDLNTPVTQAVTIRSLNRVIGTGELVNIDGHMGVRVVKLFSKKATTASQKGQEPVLGNTENNNG